MCCFVFHQKKTDFEEIVNSLILNGRKEKTHREEVQKDRKVSQIQYVLEGFLFPVLEIARGEHETPYVELLELFCVKGGDSKSYLEQEIQEEGVLVGFLHSLCQKDIQQVHL